MKCIKAEISRGEGRLTTAATATDCSGHRKCLGRALGLRMKPLGLGLQSEAWGRQGWGEGGGSTG